MFSQPAIRVNVFDQDFNYKSQIHQAVVNAALSQFEQARDKLLGLDNKLLLSGGADTLLYMLGCLRPLIAAGILLAIGYVGTSVFNRGELAKDFDEKLANLMKVYHWMAEGKTADVTKKDLFMKVAKAIAPFVQTNELTPWDFNNVSSESVSGEYKSLVATPPHNVTLIGLQPRPHATSLTETVGQALFSSESRAVFESTDSAPQHDGTLQGKAHHYKDKFFDVSRHARAEAKRAVYGYAPRPLDMRR